MPKTRDLTKHERSSIVALHDVGFSVAYLSRRFCVHRTTVTRLCNKYVKTGSIDNLPRSGRRRKTSCRQDRCLKRLQQQYPTTVSRSITRLANQQMEVNLSARTVRRRLVNMGLRSRVAKAKPMISEANKRQRLEWARRHAAWTPEQWQIVVFSDEVPISLVQISQRRYVRCHASQVNNSAFIRPKIHSGGGRMMFWGSFSNYVTGPLVEFRQSLNGEGYKRMLESNLDVVHLISVEKLFQQDNAPIHKARCVSSWFQETGLQVLDWPPQSPDLRRSLIAWKSRQRNP